jgi:hypothetical protein
METGTNIMEMILIVITVIMIVLSFIGVLKISALQNHMDDKLNYIINELDKRKR